MIAMDETIGHKRPPKGSRFPKGWSGNPKGRPRKPAPATTLGSVFNVILDKTLTITRNGVRGQKLDRLIGIRHADFFSAGPGRAIELWKFGSVTSGGRRR